MKSLQPPPWRPVLAAATLACAGATAQAAPAGEQAVVVRDAETGQLRAPTAAEAQALRDSQRQRAPQTASKAPVQRTHADGSVSVELDDSTLMYSVARRGADGTIERACVQGIEKAQSWANSAPSFARPVSTARTLRGARYEEQ